MSSMSSSIFESSVFVSEQLNRMMLNAAQDLAQRAVCECASRYNFDSDEAIRHLGLVNVKMSRTKPIVVREKVAVVKAAFPMPFNGEFNDNCCYALRQNNGLYTQCQIARKSKTTDGKNGDFCKQCQVLADKTDGMPEYGTIQQRMAADVFEYVDPKGRKPTSYTKVMKKYKFTQEEALEEAGKFNINIISNHFVVPEGEAKKGRPASKAEKEPKEPKGAKGRPKKTKKVLQIEGDDDDLFASLVADANSEEESVIVAPKKKGKTDEEKAAEEAIKAQEKQEKEAKRLQEKADKEAKLALDKQEKEMKLVFEKAQRELKKAKEEEEKLAKKLALDQASAKQKKEKEEKLAAEKEAKEASKKTKKVPAAAPTPVEDDEPDVVKKVEFEGKKYLKSKKTGIIYDYAEYTKNGEQVVIGKWNDAKNKIDFNNSEEEEEEDYEM